MSRGISLLVPGFLPLASRVSELNLRPQQSNPVKTPRKSSTPVHPAPLVPPRDTPLTHNPIFSGESQTAAAVWHTVSQHQITGNPVDNMRQGSDTVFSHTDSSVTPSPERHSSTTTLGTYLAFYLHSGLVDQHQSLLSYPLIFTSFTL